LKGGGNVEGRCSGVKNYPAGWSRGGAGGGGAGRLTNGQEGERDWGARREVVGVDMNVSGMKIERKRIQVSLAELLKVVGKK